MIGILSITFPIFAAIGLGYGTVKGGLFRQSDMRVLGAYVINIALPALIFLSVSSRSLSEVLNPAYLLVYLLGSLATLGLAYLWFTLQGVGPARRAIGAMGSACSNSGYVGYPVMMMILPDIAGLVLAMSVVVENVVIVPLCLVLLDLSRDRQSKSVPKLLVALLLGLLKRPIVIALLLAITTVASGIPLPVAVTKLLSMLAGSASALALLVIGGSLVGLPIKGNRAMAAQIAAGKLLLHPAVMFGAVLLVPMLGLPLLSQELQHAVILTAAMPMMGIYAILAQEYGHEGIASISLLGATVGAFFTLSCLLWLFS